MIIGSGLIAKSLKKSLCDNDDILIFASGVSNSSETAHISFDRERLLLEESLEVSNKNQMLFIYFSSCALIDSQHLEIPYYEHKYEMEQLIKKQAENFIIFRLPQLIGKNENKHTLINYLVDKIKIEDSFQLWQGSTRYLIEVNDLKIILESLVFDKSLWNNTIDIANPYRYTVEEIVMIIASFINKQAHYVLSDKKDSYMLNLDRFLNLCEKKSIDIDFGKNYLYQKLEEII